MAASPAGGTATGSVWTATAPPLPFAALDNSLRVDVAVVGGGITGLTAALLLKRGGARVAVIERHRVASAATGNTTAKITSLHTLVYADLVRSLGNERAEEYGAANEEALEAIAARVNDDNIECDFGRFPAVTYTTGASGLQAIEDEVEASRSLGLPASFVEQTDLPYPIRGGVRFDDQAQFHPRRYCLALARLIDGDGSRVLEQTTVTAVRPGRPCKLETTGGKVAADRVVVATLLPFMNRGLFAARTRPMRSYAIGVRTHGDARLGGMYISADSPTRSVRSHPVPGEGGFLVVGGEGHPTGEDGDTQQRFAALETWARTHFDVRGIEYRWSAQDFETLDGVPYVGPIDQLNDRILVATGFRKWGMTNGTAAAMILSGTVLGDAPPWAGVFDSTRANPRQSIRRFVTSQAAVAAHFVGDRLTRAPVEPHRLAVGQGTVARVNGRLTALSRRPDGSLVSLSAVCPHLGCIVRWNSAEQSWDCPCHGSRFDATGRVLEGPATTDLATGPEVPR
jgi:glycine/D-amino acid oxidase-like deaminating enzyme/nitrite reductase/ring-hydroxylating ferredoxin subunit